MTHIGQIKSYDQHKGIGTIVSEKGGATLGFAKADLHQPAQLPKVDQRFSYESRKGSGDALQAFNLRMQNSENKTNEAKDNKAPGKKN